MKREKINKFQYISNEQEKRRDAENKTKTNQQWQGIIEQKKTAKRRMKERIKQETKEKMLKKGRNKQTNGWTALKTEQLTNEW